MAVSSPLQLPPALRFEHPWRLDRPSLFTAPGTAIACDEQLRQQLLAGEGGPVASLHHRPRCLVVTRREARFPGFEEARRTLAGEGWPVVVRCSGGSCVPQGDGMLNLSLVFLKPQGWLLEDGYKLLCAIFARLLEGYGLDAREGEVPGSFCDGRYNLQVSGRKLLGTAQRWAGSGRGRSAVLAHACLLVEPDLEASTATVNRFYQLCGQERQFEPGACTSLREQLGAGAPTGLTADVSRRLEELLRGLFSI